VFPVTVIAAGLAGVAFVRLLFCENADENLVEGASITPGCSPDGSLVFYALAVLAVLMAVLPLITGRSVRPRFVPLSPVVPSQAKKPATSAETVK
jgi:hypothetical protein